MEILLSFKILQAGKQLSHFRLLSWERRSLCTKVPEQPSTNAHPGHFIQAMQLEEARVAQVAQTASSSPVSAAEQWEKKNNVDFQIKLFYQNLDALKNILLTIETKLDPQVFQHFKEKKNPKLKKNIPNSKTK